jgi:site-specific recombinase XerD
MAKVSSDPFFDLLFRFFDEYLPKSRNCSPHTVEAYRSSFRLFEEYYVITTGKPFATMRMTMFDNAFIAGFLSWLQDERKNSPSTIGLRLAALKSFLNFCALQDSLHIARRNSVSMFKAPVVPDQGLRYLSQEAVRAILAEPDHTTVKGLRNLTFMVVMYEAAARMQEMLDMRVSDIRIDSGISCLWLTGKGRKRRVVPIGVKATRHLARYLEAFHPKARATDDSLLFYTVIHGKRGPMSADCAERFIKKYAAGARSACEEMPQSMHSHRFRHARAMHLYQSGNDLITVRDFLGHTSIATTDIYARADTRMLNDAIQKIVPPDGGGEAKDWEDEDIAAQLSEYLKLHGFA